MKNNLITLIVVLVLLAVISYFVIGNKTAVSEVEQFLIPELQDQINDVDTIVISQNNESINLIKQSDTWKIQQAAHYFADANKIANLLLGLRKFKLKEKKTSKPENYNRLSLGENGENAAIKIQLMNSGNQFADISIGKQAQKGRGIYVRKNTEVQTWLAEGVLDVKLDSKDWIVTTIIDIDNSQIKSVTFKPIQAPEFTINKITPNDQNFALIGLPENMQLKAGIDINELAGGLKKFSIESASTNANETVPVILSVTYELFSGMKYILNISQKEEQYLMAVKLENAESSSDFNQQLENWEFIIPSYKFDALNKNLVDLIEPITNSESTTTE